MRLAWDAACPQLAMKNPRHEPYWFRLGAVMTILGLYACMPSPKHATHATRTQYLESTLKHAPGRRSLAP